MSDIQRSQRPDNDRSVVCPRRRVSARGRACALLVFSIIVTVIFIVLLDVGVIVLIIDLIRLVAEWVWWGIGAIGFLLYELYSHVVAPESWRGS